MSFAKDLTCPAASAGFVAVLVGFTSSVAIVFQAAQALHATPDIVASWMWALGLGMGLCTLLPSLWWKKPVMVAWSTPGAAVLASAATLGNYSMAEAVGAFLVCALLITVAGASGWFERIMNRIPMALASALLAGVLTHFGLAGFAAAQSALPLVCVMLLCYLACRRWLPRYAVPLTFLVAIGFVAMTSGFTRPSIDFGFANPVWVAPHFTFAALVSLALPLFIVTMASQNLPGVAAIQAGGYGGPQGIPISRVITISGLATLLLAPFGAFALNLAAITASICMGPDVHPDPRKRYTAAVCCGAIYLLIGIFGAAVTGVLTAFPKELVAAIAGLALLGTISGALLQALEHAPHREAAIVTFLVTLSGVSIAGVGSAFWGVVAGALALLVQHLGRASLAPPPR